MTSLSKPGFCPFSFFVVPERSWRLPPPQFRRQELRVITGMNRKKPKPFTRAMPLRLTVS
jgi:hypothetical protein